MTKQEILDEDGKVRRGCRVVKKGEVYERILFDKKDVRFKQKGFLNEVKVCLTDQINLLVKTPEEELKVFDRNSAYLPTKKIGKNNPLEEEIKKDNEARTRWNETVDQAVIAEVPELEIIKVKQEHITMPVKESIEKDGYRPWRFRDILSMAIRKLEEVIERVVDAARKLKERIDRLMERVEQSREEYSDMKTETVTITRPTENAPTPKVEKDYSKTLQHGNEHNRASSSHIEPKGNLGKSANSDNVFLADADAAEYSSVYHGGESHTANKQDEERNSWKEALHSDRGHGLKEGEIQTPFIKSDIKEKGITDAAIVNTVFETHVPQKISDKKPGYGTIAQTPEKTIMPMKEEPMITLLALPPTPIKPILNYDYTAMYQLNEQLKQRQDVIFSLQKERNAKEIEWDDLGKFNVIKKNKLTGEIGSLENQIEKKKRELSSILKQHGFETASEFIKVIKGLKGQVDGYNRKATGWNEQKRQIEALNKRIISGEMSLELAI